MRFKHGNHGRIFIMPNRGLASTFLVFLVRLDFRLFQTDVMQVRKVCNGRHAPANCIHLWNGYNKHIP